MAQLDEIVGKSNIQQVLDLDKALNSLDQTFMKVLKSSKETAGVININTDSYAKLKVVQEQTLAQTTKLGEAEKQAEKIRKDQAAAMAALEKQRQKGLEQMAKQEAAEREMASALTKEVKSIEDARKQNAALTKARNQLNQTTAEGKKQAEAYNKTIDKNTEFIRKNSDAATKQKMNIGNYKSALEGLPGPLGRVATSVSLLGKQLWTLAANPIVTFIAALVGALKLLWDSFKATDTGADTLEQTTTALGAAYKVVTDRIGEVLNGHRKLKDLLPGMRQEILDTATAAGTYAETMDKINERLGIFASEEADLKYRAAELSRIYKDDRNSNEERIAALQEYLDIEQRLMEFKKEAAEQAYRAKLVEITQAQTATDFTVGQIESFIKMNTYAQEEVKKSDPLWAAFWDTQSEGVLELETAYSNLRNIETDYFNQTGKKFGTMTNFITELERQKTAAAKDEAEKRTKIAEQEAQEAASNMQVNKLGFIETEELKTKAFLEELEIRNTAEAETWQERMQREEDERQRKLQNAQEYLYIAAEYGQQLFDINQMLIDAELTKIEQAKAYELQLAGDNVEKRTEIERKYDKEASKLKQRQAKQDKAQALFNAIIKTAQAVIAGLAYGPPLGYIFAALNAVLGAVQIGVIASQPIPQFFKGTESAPDGLISVAEKGEELIKTRSGHILLATRPTILSGMKGAQIYSNPETEALLKYRNVGYDSKELRQTLERNNEKLIKTIQNKREIYITPPRGSQITARQGDFFTHYWTRKLG